MQNLVKQFIVFSEREKIKFVVFPLSGNHLLMVSIEKKESQHDGIIKNILKMIKESDSSK